MTQILLLGILAIVALHVMNTVATKVVMLRVPVTLCRRVIKAAGRLMKSTPFKIVPIVLRT